MSCLHVGLFQDTPGSAPVLRIPLEFEPHIYDAQGDTVLTDFRTDEVGRNRNRSCCIALNPPVIQRVPLDLDIEDPAHWHEGL
jgi:hypothetical protein